MVIKIDDLEVHWRWKWSRRPKQWEWGKTVPEYCNLFSIWKEQMVSISFPVDEGDYIDGFIGNLSENIRLRLSKSRHRRNWSRLNDAFNAAKFEESMMLLEESIKQFEAHMVFDKMPSQLSGINFQQEGLEDSVCNNERSYDVNEQENDVVATPLKADTGITVTTKAFDDRWKHVQWDEMKIQEHRTTLEAIHDLLALQQRKFLESIWYASNEMAEPMQQPEASSNAESHSTVAEVLEVEDSLNYEEEATTKRVLDAQGISEKGACDGFDEMLQPIPVSLTSDAFLFEDEDNDYVSSKFKSQQSNENSLINKAESQFEELSQSNSINIATKIRVADIPVIDYYSKVYAHGNMETNKGFSSMLDTKQLQVLGTVIEGDKVIGRMFKPACAHEVVFITLKSMNPLFDEVGQLYSLKLEGLRDTQQLFDAMPSLISIKVYDENDIHLDLDAQTIGLLNQQKNGLLKVMFGEVGVFMFDPGILLCQFVDGGRHPPLSKIVSLFDEIEQDNGIEAVNIGLIDSNGVTRELWFGKRLLFAFDPGGSFYNGRKDDETEFSFIIISCKPRDVEVAVLVEVNKSHSRLVSKLDVGFWLEKMSMFIFDPGGNFLYQMRWKPKGCSLPRLDENHRLDLLRGKMLVFVGDSLNKNMWDFLVCTLFNCVKNHETVYAVSCNVHLKTEASNSFAFADYKCTIEFMATPFLVQEWEIQGETGEKEGHTLVMLGGSANNYNDVDIICSIFNPRTGLIPHVIEIEDYFLFVAVADLFRFPAKYSNSYTSLGTRMFLRGRERGGYTLVMVDMIIGYQGTYKSDDEKK